MVAVLVVVNATTRDTSSPKCFNREGVFVGVSSHSDDAKYENV